jgi:flagellar biosynthesis protein FlgN
MSIHGRAALRSVPPRPQRSVGAVGGSARSRQAAIDRVMRGVGDDMRDYRALLGLLDEQFDAALRHDAVRVEDVGQRILAAVDGLEGRRRERVALVELLLGPDGRMDELIGTLAPPRQGALDAGWKALQTLVRQCKELNARNCRLMTDQQAVMQRVLHGDMETYAPA